MATSDDDATWATLGSGGTSATTQAAPADGKPTTTVTQPAAKDDDATWSTLGTQQPAADAGAAPLAPPEPSLTEKASAAAVRGYRDIIDPLRAGSRRLVEAVVPQSWLSTTAPSAADIEAENKAAREAYEKRYGDSDVAGAVRTGTQLAFTVPALMAGGGLVRSGVNALAAGAGAAGPAISTVADFLGGASRGAGPVTNLLARGASTAAQGAVIGGATGALTSGQSDQPVTQQAIQGAETGAVLGPAVSAAGAIIGAPFKALAARMFPGVAQSQAVGKVAEALSRDGLTPADVQANLTRLGPEAGLVDAGGVNVRRLGETVANQPGPGAEAAESFLEGRASGQQSRINTAIRAATGSQADFHDALTDLTQQRSQAARPLYDNAFNNTIVAPQDAGELDRFIADKIGQAGLQRGLRTIELEHLADGTPFNPADYGVTKGDDGNYTLTSGTPNLRLFDAVKRGMDSIAEQYRNPTTGQMDFAKYDDNFGSGRAVDNLRKAYVGELRSRFPDYADALDAWSGPSKAIDALTMGRRALANDPEVSARAIAGLSDSEKEFFKAGVARALKDKAESVQDSADATRRIFGNQLIRDKISAAFGDPDAFRQFQQTMENEAAFARTRNEVLKGSPTARRLAGAADIDVVSPALMAAHGHLIGAAANVGQQAMNALAQRSGDPVKTAIGRMLFSPDAGNEYLAALQRAQNPLMRPALRTAGIAAGASERNRLAPYAQ